MDELYRMRMLRNFHRALPGNIATRSSIYNSLIQEQLIRLLSPQVLQRSHKPKGSTIDYSAFGKSVLTLRDDLHTVGLVTRVL